MHAERNSAMAERIGFGILGCGVIGPHHAEAIAGLHDDARLVAVADRTPERAQALAQKHGVPAYSTLDELLAHPGVDVVCVCTPSGMHAENAATVLRAGKHVVIEKPIDVTLEAIETLRAARQSPAQKI